MMAEPSDTREVHDIAVWLADEADPRDCYRAFEAYGHAMTAASTFEMLMALMVMKALVLRLDKRANARIAAADHTTVTASLLRGSYDRLQRQLKNSFSLSAELVQGLADGKEARDHLAHNFWQGHAANLLSSDGVDVIAAECAQAANHFRLLARALFAETGVDARDYVAMLRDDPQRQQKLAGWQQLLAELGLH
jgi:uncharacterized membrane-anchored protein YhcB (DUF1043 family)